MSWPCQHKARAVGRGLWRVEGCESYRVYGLVWLRGQQVARKVPSKYHRFFSLRWPHPLILPDVKDDFEYLLLHELFAGMDRAAALALLHQAASVMQPLGRTCSMFGAWGSRTADSNLVSGRNLDWQSQTGVSKHKVSWAVGCCCLWAVGCVQLVVGCAFGWFWFLAVVYPMTQHKQLGPWLVLARGGCCGGGLPLTH